MLCIGIDFIPGFKIEKAGNFSYGGARIRVLHFAPAWRMSAQGSQTVVGEIEDQTNRWILRGKMLLSGIRKTVQISETFVKRGPLNLDFSVEISSDEDIPTEQLSLSVDLPIWIYASSELWVDGQRIPLPEKPLGKTIVWSNFSKLTCPTPEGLLIFSGRLFGQLQDGRDANGDPFFRLRFYFNPHLGEIRNSQIRLAMETIPYGSNQQKPLFSKMGTSLTADSHWSSITQGLCPVSNSILDWSKLSKFKAGRSYVVVSSNGHFELESEPGNPLRLYGANICDRANFLNRDECEQLALQLSRQGYNAVRLHHYDRHLVANGKPLAFGWDTNALEKLDYLFFCLKRAGLFITIDLYTLRPVLAGEIEEVKRDVVLGEFKALVAVSPTARSNWKQFASQLLTHVNPHTGLKWKDDPALFGICLLNENAVPSVWDSSPDIATIYRERYLGWLKARKMERGNDGAWARFLIETHQAMLQDLTGFVKNLGTRALLTDANFGRQRVLSLIRQNLDYVDNHEYFDLRQFIDEPFRLPYRYSQKSATKNFASVPRSLFATRLMGVPFTVTEFNFCYPNHDRAEGGALMGAYSALQDWDGIFRYAYSHAPQRVFTDQPIFYLDNVSDPINMLSDRISILLFTRGDVRPGKGLFRVPGSDSLLNEPKTLESVAGSATAEEERMGFFCRVGIDSNLAKGAKPPEIFGAEYVSDTKELFLSPMSGQFSVITPKTECFVLPGNSGRSGQFIRVSNHSGLSVVCLSAMDGHPLRDSKKLILFHLTDVQNSGVQFLDPNHTILGSWGQLPILLRRGELDVSLPSVENGAYHVRAIKLDGTPGPDIEVVTDQLESRFSISTLSAKGNFMVYELTRP